MEELENKLKELRRFEAPWREQKCQLAKIPEDPGGTDYQAKNTNGVTHGAGQVWPEGV